MKKGVKKVFLSLLVCIFVLFLLAIIGTIIYASSINIDSRKLKKNTTSLSLLDNNDNVITANKSYTELENIPKNLQNAFIATEDKRFYSHKGLDYYRILGAIVHDIKTHSLEQGASTITCQLVKNTHLTNEKTIKRKIDEAILAKKIEKEFTKDEILEMYLNIIYFGSGIYGVTNASFMFFGKEPEQLTLNECASIAAVVANPKKYSPLIDIKNNNSRKNTILKLMHEQNLISNEDYLAANAQNIETNSPLNAGFQSYNQLAIEEASKILGLGELELKKMGYKIYTYLDVDEQIKCFEQIKKADVATSILIENVGDYSIKAYASNHIYSPFTMKRNAGSIIKPFIYASAFENGVIYPITTIDDSPTSFGDYTPNNYSNKYRGLITAREALSYSSNICSVKVLQSVGFYKANNTLSKFGINVNEKDYNYSLALGAISNGVTIADISNAYAVLASNGYYSPLSTVRMIKDGNDNIVYSRKISSNKVIDENSVTMLNDCLNECANKGTARKLSRYKNLCAKTGTFEVNGKNSDSWVVAYDRNNVYTVWQGNLTMKSEDMIEKTGSSGIVYLEKLIDDRITPPPRQTKKQAIDLLVLNRTNQIKLASNNTPERYIIYDYAPNNAEVSKLFLQPTVDANITLSDNKILIELNAQKECSYIVQNETMLGTITIAEISNTNKKVEIQTDALIGLNTIKILPIVHGKSDIIGDCHIEKVYN